MDGWNFRCPGEGFALETLFCIGILIRTCDMTSSFVLHLDLLSSPSQGEQSARDLARDPVVCRRSSLKIDEVLK